MNMDDEIVTWNLRGPKRMRKRKELNALVKNNIRYKKSFKNNSSIDMFNMNSGASRLLGKSNDSTSENDDYYFSANKQIIREKRRRNCCKLIQITLVGFLITVAMIVGITLVFSYSKFHDALKDLKNEFQSQKEQNQVSISEVKRKLDQYDALFKKDLKTFNSNSNTQNQTKLVRSIRSIGFTNRLNSYLIKYLYNKTSTVENDPKTLHLLNLVRGDSTKNKSELSDVIYRNLVNKFLRNNGQYQLNEDQLFNQYARDDQFKLKLFDEIESLYIKPVLETLEKCDCKTSKLIVKKEIPSN